MTEFQQLVKDAPKFASMECDELVACAYAMYAAGVKMDAENARLLDLVRILVNCMGEVDRCDTCPINGNPYDVSVEDWFACDSLRDMLVEVGVLDS